MAEIGDHASHERLPPRQLNRWVGAGEKAGFTSATDSSCDG